MRTCPPRSFWRAGLLASLLVIACDPPPGTGKGSPGADGAPGERTAVADAALGKAKVVILEDGTIQIYDRFGDLRATIVDPKARFSETIEPIAGTKEWAKPSPQLTVPLGGLATWLTKRGQERKAKAALEAKGLTESQRMMVAIAESAERTEQRLGELDGELSTLWADTAKAAADRRRLLFVRWDECEEGERSAEVLRIGDASTAADAIRKDAGARARGMIEAFVRKELPVGSAEGYSEEELVRLNEGRASTRVFAPYAKEAGSLAMPKVEAEVPAEVPASPEG